MDLKEFKLLMVGAGGIGCELLKNLVLTGFTQIDVIDLDTIELSNLNRQFLFQKCHVGAPKATTAIESVSRYNTNPDNYKIEAFHNSIMGTEYNFEYFNKFDLVLNALDNKAARSHVNRMCLATDTPLIESGSAGYLGQVTLIKKGVTECYDCLAKPAAKTFPGCTIRNTPSEPIHCIVWAKHLFNQLFGSEDPDEAVSPDGEDPENMADAGKTAVGKGENEEAVERVSTRQWAKETNYNAEKLFNKLFGDDIKYLLSMAKLWETRKAPEPLVWKDCIENGALLDQVQLQASTSTSTSSTSTNGATSTNPSDKLASHKVLTMQQYCELFRDSVASLCKRCEESGESEEEKILVWDKDDLDAMKFVTAASNLRSFIFSITPKSQFETKSLAGNIIPAIATTNAIVAGLIVVQALKVLSSKPDECKTAYVRDRAVSNKVIVGTQLVKPNESCYVCAPKPEIKISLNVNKFTVKQFEQRVCIGELNMVMPDIEIDDGTGRVICSSEPGETEANDEKVLSVFLKGETEVKLSCDDFHQDYSIKISICHSETLEDGKFEIVSENQMLKDRQADLQKEKDEPIKVDIPTTTITTTSTESTTEEDITEICIISPSNEEKKRRYDAAFEGDNSKSEIEDPSKRARKSNDSVQNNECEGNGDDESNSINDASDALSEEEEVVVEAKEVKLKVKKAPREIIIDDDIIIEEDSNDMKSDDEAGNENKTNWSNHPISTVESRAEYQRIIDTNNANVYHDETSGNIDDDEDDDDIIECSSTGSDIIEIDNDEADEILRTANSDGFLPIQNSPVNLSNNNNINNINCQIKSNDSVSQNGPGPFDKGNKGLNIKNGNGNGHHLEDENTNGITNNNSEDSITTID